jgi:hypothetical protein
MLITNRIGRQYHLRDDDTLMEKHLARENGPYQVRNLRFLRRLLPNARTVIDVGANIGMNTIEYATWCQSVHSFEPSAETYQRLVANIALNRSLNPQGRYYHKGQYQHLPDYADGWYRTDTGYAPLTITGSITTHNVALGAQPGRAELISANRGLADYVRPVAEVLDLPNTIEIRTIDQYAFESVDIIKIDTEGTEWPIVQGADQTIQTCRPIVQVEMYGWERRLGIRNQDMLDYFQSADYEMFDYRGTRLPWTVEKIKGVMDRFFVPKGLL